MPLVSQPPPANPPEGLPAAASRQRAGWRELLARRHLPQLLVLCLAIWLHAANSMLTATTLPGAVGDIGGLRLISWAFALYLMGSIVAATSISVWVAGHGLRRTMMAATLLYTLGCVICAAAPSMPVLLVGRTVQGLGGVLWSRWSTSPRTASFPIDWCRESSPAFRWYGRHRRFVDRSSAAHSRPPGCGDSPSGRSHCRGCCSRWRCVR